MEQRQTVERQIEKKSFSDKILSSIETVGNKLPDPVTMFICLCAIILVTSYIVGTKGVSVVHPGTEETVTAVNLLSVEQLQN